MHLNAAQAVCLADNLPVKQRLNNDTHNNTYRDKWCRRCCFTNPGFVELRLAAVAVDEVCCSNTFSQCKQILLLAPHWEYPHQQLVWDILFRLRQSLHHRVCISLKFSVHSKLYLKSTVKRKKMLLCSYLAGYQYVTMSIYLHIVDRKSHFFFQITVHHTVLLIQYQWCSFRKYNW